MLSPVQGILLREGLPSMNLYSFCKLLFKIRVKLAHFSESDEPPSARTPLRDGKKNVYKIPDKTLGTPSKKTRQVPSLGPLNTLSTPPAQRPSVAKTPRTNTKKSRLQAELQRRQEYAEQIFIELNSSVFKQGLPENTKLNWSKRLLTTAGKAKYHRFV